MMSNSNTKKIFLVTLLYLTLLPITISSEVEGDIDSTVYDYDYSFELIGGLTNFPAIERFPWMVSFGEYYNQTIKWNHFCGGAIISSFCVVTAAHCFFGHGDYFTRTKIRIGDQNFSSTADDYFSRTYEIRTVIKHPGYRRGLPRNDLALVFTETEIEFNVKTNSIDLPSANNPIIDVNTNQSAKFSGWGCFNGSNIFSDALRSTNYTIYTGKYCGQQFRSKALKHHLENTTIIYCAGTDDASSWSCKGDSGSPLVVETGPLQHTLVGILHGSRLQDCTPDIGLFANLEHEDNMNFIQKWLPLGEYFASMNTTDTDIFYLKKLDPYIRTQYLWRHYPPSNEDMYRSSFFSVCKNSTFGIEQLEGGMDCSMYNSMIYNICQNGNTEKANFEKYSVNCSITKMLVVSGQPSAARKTELMDLAKPNINCVLPDFPIDLSGAVGFNSAEGPMVCGGDQADPKGIFTNINDGCFVLNNNQEWKPLISMTTPRSYAAAVQIDYDNILIFGGFHVVGQGIRIRNSMYAKVHSLNSIEIMDSNGSEAFGKLPFTIAAHCIIRINATSALITGGRQNGSISDATWIIDIDTLNITSGPKLQNKRGGHGCATLKLGIKKYGIVSGGLGPEYHLDTTEFIDLQTRSIVKGPKLLRKMHAFSMVSTSKGILVLGGNRHSEILQLDCQDAKIENCEWKPIVQKMEVARSSHVVIPLPESYDICTVPDYPDATIATKMQTIIVCIFAAIYSITILSFVAHLAFRRSIGS